MNLHFFLSSLVLQAGKTTGPPSQRSSLWAPVSTKTLQWTSLWSSRRLSRSCTTSGCVSSFLSILYLIKCCSVILRMSVLLHCNENEEIESTRKRYQQALKQLVKPSPRICCFSLSYVIIR